MNKQPKNQPSKSNVTTLPTNKLPEGKKIEEAKAATPAPTAAPQKIEETAKAGDQKTTGTAEKKKRKFSAQHNNWKAQQDLPLTAKITMLVKGNPKRAGSKSADRFALHEDGFTVQQYIDKCKEAGISEKLCMMDVRWDYTKKFIDVK